MTIGAFAIIIVLRRQGLIGDELDDLNGLIKRSPVAAVLLLIFMLSLAGIPPLAGFVGKYFILLSLIQTGHYYLALIRRALHRAGAVLLLPHRGARLAARACGRSATAAGDAGPDAGAGGDVPGDAWSPAFIPSLSFAWRRIR